MKEINYDWEDNYTAEEWSGFQRENRLDLLDEVVFKRVTSEQANEEIKHLEQMFIYSKKIKDVEMQKYYKGQYVKFLGRA